jgi:hypothetical protein
MNGIENSRQISEEDWSSTHKICSVGNEIYIIASTAEVYKIDAKSGEYSTVDVSIVAGNPLAWQPLRCWVAAGY